MAEIRTLHVKTPKGFVMPLHFDIEDKQQKEDYYLLEIALSCPETSYLLHHILAQELEVFRFRCRQEFTEAMQMHEKKMNIGFLCVEELTKHQIKQRSLIDEAVLKVSSYWLYASRQLKNALCQHLKEHKLLEMSDGYYEPEQKDDLIVF